MTEEKKPEKEEKIVYSELKPGEKVAFIITGFMNWRVFWGILLIVCMFAAPDKEQWFGGGQEKQSLYTGGEVIWMFLGGWLIYSGFRRNVKRMLS